MRKSLRGIAGWTAALLVAAPLLAASPAFADCEGMREFTGLLQSMKKGNKGGFVVDNRQGDKVKFVRDETSAVVDERGGDKPKAKWDDLANGDYVSVCWKFTDNPRKAYKVVVKPAPSEAAEEVE
jgi:hypothetical protein